MLLLMVAVVVTAMALAVLVALMVLVLVLPPMVLAFWIGLALPKSSDDSRSQCSSPPWARVIEYVRRVAPPPPCACSPRTACHLQSMPACGQLRD